MSIATKNGSVIVKDGKLAENCGCCSLAQTCLDCPYYGCAAGSPYASMSRSSPKYLSWRIQCDGVTATTPDGTLVAPALDATGSLAFGTNAPQPTFLFSFFPDDGTVPPSCSINTGFPYDSIFVTAGAGCLSNTSTPECAGVLVNDFGLGGVLGAFYIAYQQDPQCRFWINFSPSGTSNPFEVVYARGCTASGSGYEFRLSGRTYPGVIDLPINCIDSLIGRQLTFSPYGTSVSQVLKRTFCTGSVTASGTGSFNAFPEATLTITGWSALP